MKKKNKKHKKHNKKRTRRKLSKREKRIMRVKRSLKKGAKKLRLSAKRTGAYVFGTLRKIFGNPYTKYGVMLTDVKLLGTGLELKKGERVGYIRATNIPGGGVFVRPMKLRGIWKMASRDDSIYIRPQDFLESIRTTKMSGAPLRDNPGARYRVGGGYQTFTLEEAKKEADRIFREKGIIVSIEEYKAIPQVKPDWKYGIYTGRGIARNRRYKGDARRKREADAFYSKYMGPGGDLFQRATRQEIAEYQNAPFSDRARIQDRVYARVQGERMMRKNPRLGKYEQKALDFARKYRGWHGFDPRKPTANIVRRLEKKGLVKVSNISNQFRAI